MKIITVGVKKIRRLLGKQKIKFNGVRYRRMKYLLQADYCGGLLLHNVITGCMVWLNEKEANALEALPVEANTDNIELIENYFLVPEEYDERETVLSLRLMSRRLFSAKGMSSFTIFTTTNCNARCFYCYEKNCSRINMDAQTADRVVDFIADHKSEGLVKLGWFGGEPLICADRIDQICNGLKDRGIEYESGMTTNGYLFDQELVKKSVDLWHLAHLQISLDGQRDTYNRVKAYVTADKNPYEHVMDNIGLLLKAGIKVSLRINFDLYNLNEIEALSRELKERFEGFDVSVYPHFILQKSDGEMERRSQVQEDKLITEQIRLTRFLVDIGLRKRGSSLPRLLTRACGADSSESIVIYPDGRLYKCIDVSEDDDKVGIIGSSKMDETVISQYHERFELDRCKDCPIFPYCIVLAKCPDVGKKNPIYCDYRVRLGPLVLKDWAERNQIVCTE